MGTASEEDYTASNQIRQQEEKRLANVRNLNVGRFLKLLDEHDLVIISKSRLAELEGPSNAAKRYNETPGSGDSRYFDSGSQEPS